MTSHLLLMVVFSLFVSVTFAALMRNEPREQVRFGAQLFAAFVLGGVAIGWLLYPLPF